jgi:hypothetical protein
MPNDLTLYHKYRPLMKTGDVLLYKSRGSVIGWIIQKYTKYNHAGLVLRFGPDEHGADRVWILEAVGQGVKPAFLSDKLAKYPGKVWWYPLRAEFDHQRDLVTECAMILKDTSYDFKALIKNALGRVSVNLQQLFCSEYVQVALSYAKIIEEDVAARPGDIPKWPVFDSPVLIVEHEKGKSDVQDPGVVGAP